MKLKDIKDKFPKVPKDGTILKDIKKDIKEIIPFQMNKIKVYSFVGPSGTGKSYRAQMVASERNIE